MHLAWPVDSHSKVRCPYRVNVVSLNCFEDGTVVDPVLLIEAGIVKNIRDGVRILGNGELTKALTVQAMGFSKTAEEKIIAAGGKVEVI